MKSVKAFTLIELLVVIAIIAILAAILFPVFAQAKLAAKKTASLSNNKQTNLGILMYINDADDTFPYAQNGNWTWADTWIVNVQPYIKSFQLLLAPNDNNPRVDGSGPPYSYAGNGMVCWDWKDSPSGWYVHGLMSARQTWWQNWDTSFTSTGVGLPAETILLGERHSLDQMNPSTFEMRGAWDDNFNTFVGWTQDLPGQGPLPGDLWGKPTNKPGTAYVGYNGVSTFSFVDGHSSALNPLKTIDGAGYNNGNCDSTYFKMWDGQRTQ